MKNKIRILFTGGGTGGHIYPLIAVIKKTEEIAQKHNFGVDFRFAGAPGKYYKNILEGHNIRVVEIMGSKIRRYFSFLNFLEPFRFLISLIQSLVKVYLYMPDVIFSKSGPGSLAVVIAGWFYRIPIVIHESDSVPGLTSRMSAKLAKSIGVSFAAAGDYFKGKNVAVTGNPIAPNLLGSRDEQDFAKRYFGFDPDMPLILVLGGSQGSERINDFVIQSAGEILNKYQILHQTGQDKFSEAKGELKFIADKMLPEIKKRYKLVAYFNKDIKEAYAAADLVVARAGATTMFEVAYFGKPAIFIPLPLAAGDHQRHNAHFFAEAGAGVVLEEQNLLTNVFVTQVNKILEKEGVKEKMMEASRKFATPQAAEVLAEEVLRLGTS